MRKAFTLVLLALAIMIVGVSCDEPKHEHSYDANVWEKDGTSHWHVCTTCSEKVEVAEHTLKTTEAKKPTCVDKGWDAYVTCSVCGYSTYEEKAALGHDFTGTDGKCTSCENTKENVEKAEARIGLVYYTNFEEAVHEAVKSDKPDEKTVEVLKEKITLENAHCPEVNGSVTINANNCDFGGGDISIYTYNTHTAAADNKTGDVKIVINEAKNLGIWGTGSLAAEGTTIDIEVNDCTFNKTGACWIVLTGSTVMKGTLNIKVENCKAENLNDTTTLDSSSGYQANFNNAVRTSLADKVEVINCTFENVFMPISVTKDSNGEGEVIVDNCTFIDCGRSTESETGNENKDKINPQNVKLAAPIRVRHSADSGKDSTMKVTIKNSTITGTKCISDLGDVLLVEARDGKKWKALTAVFENNKTDLKVKVDSTGDLKTVVSETSETFTVAANLTT